jgi:hypothetical protein
MVQQYPAAHAHIVFILDALGDKEDPLISSCLAADFGSIKPGIVFQSFVELAVVAEIVIREAVGSSAYRALLRLTQEGFALAEVINQKAAMAVEMVSQGLPPEKRAVFYETLELITNNLQTLSKQGIPDTEVKEKHTHD